MSVPKLAVAAALVSCFAYGLIRVCKVKPFYMYAIILATILTSFLLILSVIATVKHKKLDDL